MTTDTVSEPRRLATPNEVAEMCDGDFRRNELVEQWQERFVIIDRRVHVEATS